MQKKTKHTPASATSARKKNPGAPLTQKRHPGGRPTLYRPEYCQQIVDYGREGKSLLKFASDIGVSRSVLQDWATVHNEFLVALTRAKEARAAVYEELALHNARTGEGNASMIQFQLCNCASEDYCNKQETKLSGNVTLGSLIVEADND